MAQRRMLLNKNDTFVPHLTISYTRSRYNYDDRVYITCYDDNIKYKITGKDNHGVIEIMFKNEFILNFYIEFVGDIENIVIQNETDNLITLNGNAISTEWAIRNCEVYGKFKFNRDSIQSDSTGDIHIYGPNCIFEDYSFTYNISDIYYYDKLTPIEIIMDDIYGYVYAHPHILYDLMKYNNIEEGDKEAKEYKILDNTKLIISSPTNYIITYPNVDLGDNNYIRSVNNYMYEGQYITEYGCSKPITHLRNGITLPQNATVYFPDSVIAIDSNTFYKENNLKKVVIFGNCKLAYLGGFESSGLENIEIYSDKIETIKEDCFYSCKKLHNITISKSVKFIEDGSFNHLGNGFNFVINYKGTIEDWSDINLNDDWCYGSTITTIHCSNGDIQL